MATTGYIGAHDRKGDSNWYKRGAAALDAIGVRPQWFGFYDERRAVASPVKSRPDLVQERNRSLGA